MSEITSIVKITSHSVGSKLLSIDYRVVKTPAVYKLLDGKRDDTLFKIQDNIALMRAKKAYREGLGKILDSNVCNVEIVCEPTYTFNCKL